MSNSDTLSNFENTRNKNMWRSIKYKLRAWFRPSSIQSLEQSVDELIQEHNIAEGGEKISTEEREIIHNVLSFGDTKVSAIMVPRTDIVAVEYNISLEELKEIIISKEHTRMPVYNQSLDNVVGFIHVKDLIPVLTGDKPFVMENIIRKIPIISPSMKVTELLAQMRSTRVHIALVLDEYGGTDGLVTIEDVVEEIVGEIQDEHDNEEAEYIISEDGTIEASARLDIDTLEDLLNIKIESDESFETVGGLVLSLSAHIPSVGEVLNHPCGITLEIMEADQRRIKKLRIKKITSEEIEE
jgi:magnesium and cobalt transporter